nr:hypothetical protein [Tanacetum cinerariifolium]
GLCWWLRVPAGRHTSAGGFISTAVVHPNEAGHHDLVATIDGHEVVVTESLIRTQLQLADANGIFDMPVNDIFEGMRVIGFILEGMIGNVKAPKHKFLMYPRFLQIILAFETADRTPRPTSTFTRKLFTNMKFRWAQDLVLLTPSMMAIAAGGNAAGDAPAGAAAGGDAPAGAAAGGDAADEANVVANDAAGGAAEAPQVPQSPSVSPVREPIPERQPTPERLLFSPPSSPETEWVVPDPVSPVVDWRPWPYVHVHFSEPESPPFPSEQTFLYEEHVEFGPVPRPTGYVDPDDIEPIFFGPQPRPDNYVEPEDLML